MPTNEIRRELLNRAKASGYPGSITEVFQAADQGIDLIEQHQMQEQQQEMQVAQTPQEQEVGVREQHPMGNTPASMAFPDVQPGQSFNTVGMQAPIDIQKVDNQGHLVESYENVPPGIQDLPTGPSEGTIIESPEAYQKGGFNFNKKTDYSQTAINERNKNRKINWGNLETGASFAPYLGEAIDFKNTIQDFRSGDYVGAAANAAGFAIPFVPGKVIKQGVNKVRQYFSKSSPNVFQKNVPKGFVRVQRPDNITGTGGDPHMLIPKGDANKINRIEDANLTNKMISPTDYETGNWYGDNYNDPFYVTKTKVAGTTGGPGNFLSLTEPRSVYTGYLHPAHKSKFNLSTDVSKNMSFNSGELMVPPGIQQPVRGGQNKPWLQKTTVKDASEADKLLTNFYKKRFGGFQTGGGAPWEVKKGVRAVESSNGVNMINTSPTSTATGYYGQRFSEIEDLPFMKNINRNTFAADTMLQNKVFDMRWKGEIPGVPGLKNNVKKLRNDYGELTSNFTDNELAALSNYTGRERARRYFAALRDGKEFKMPGQDEGKNKSVEQYMKEYRDAIKKKQLGGIRDTILDLKSTGEEIKAYYDKVRKPTIIDNKNFKLKGDINPFKQRLAFNTKYAPTKNTTFTGGVEYRPGYKPQYTAGLNIRLKKGGLRKCKYGCW